MNKRSFSDSFSLLKKPLKMFGTIGSVAEKLPGTK